MKATKKAKRPNPHSRKPHRCYRTRPLGPVDANGTEYARSVRGVITRTSDKPVEKKRIARRAKKAKKQLAEELVLAS